jgi:DNA polymerase I-like protein with 3'-5' exonuclease and polymerase domains
MSKVLKTRTRYALVGSDFSAQEPRLTAYMSQDPKMIQAYLDGKDLYAVIAQSMFNNEYWENLEFYPEGTEIELDGKHIICGKKTHLHKAGKERRSAAKTMLLAILYGMSPATAGARMGKTAEEGQKLMDNFFTQFPKVKELMDKSKEMLANKGYVEDWAGRRRHLPDFSLEPYEFKPLANTSNFNPFMECEDRVTAIPENILNKWIQKKNEAIAKSQERQRKNAAAKGLEWKDNGEMSNAKYEALAQEARKDGVLFVANTGKRAQAERQCLNARIQGGAASLTKLAMVNVDKDQELKDLNANLVITVHDEVLVECPLYYADKVEKRLPQVMIDTAAPYINVPMACDPYVVRQWYIDEYSVSIQAEFKKAEEHGLTKEEALIKVSENHPEVSLEAITYTVETGEPIDTDKFPVPTVADVEIDTLDCAEESNDYLANNSLFNL